MTAQEKMLQGKLFFPADPTLKAQRLRARDMLFEYNTVLRPSQGEERQAMLRKLFGTTGKKFSVNQPFQCDYGYNIHIGENFYANTGCTILDCAPVRIGDNVMLAPNVALFTAGHPIDPEKRATGVEFAHPITIGNNVWIGGNSVVLPNVTIGDNCVIGAGSVVSKDIPPNSVAVGNPCRVIRQINENDKIYYFKQQKYDE